MDENQRDSGTSEQMEEERPTSVETPSPAEPVADVYPLRDPSEDPRWALWVVRIWVTIALALFLLFIVLLVLGIWYD